MRLTHSLLLMVLAGVFGSSAHADNCADLATRFAGGERFHMTLGELDELKTCINAILREKISATSNEARGSTSPPSSADSMSASTLRPRAVPILQDAE